MIIIIIIYTPAVLINVNLYSLRILSGMDVPWICVLPPALTACISSLILTIQLRKQHTFDSILLSGDLPDAGVRFSTVKRDAIVVAVTTLQSALFAFLVGFRLGAALESEVRLNPTCAGVLAVCWVSFDNGKI